LTHLRHLGGGFLQGLVAILFAGKIEKEARLLKAGTLFFPAVDDGFKRGLLLENALGFFRVVPEIRL
jgi:hypothetical protein